MDKYLILHLLNNKYHKQKTEFNYDNGLTNEKTNEKINEKINDNRLTNDDDMLWLVSNSC